MKVEYVERNGESNAFKNLDLLDVFVFKSELYIKTDRMQGIGNAINVETCKRVCILLDDIVTPKPDAKLVVSR